MKEVALSEVKDQLSKYLHEAEKEEVVITRHGKPAGVLIGFKDEDEWFEYRLENDPRFLERIEQTFGGSVSATTGVVYRVIDHTSEIEITHVRHRSEVYR